MLLNKILEAFSKNYIWVNTLSLVPHSHSDPVRKGRGGAARKGRRSGKGNKGQRARARNKIPRLFEGGQTPVTRSLPKWPNLLTKETRESINTVCLDSASIIISISQSIQTEFQIEDLLLLTKKDSQIKKSQKNIIRILKKDIATNPEDLSASLSNKILKIAYFIHITKGAQNQLKDYGIILERI